MLSLSQFRRRFSDRGLSLRYLGLLLGLATALHGAVPDPVFPSQGEPATLLTDEARFRPFAQTVKAEVIGLLQQPDVAHSPSRLRMLLAIRVHLALDEGDTATALVVAHQIQQLQTGQEERVFAGITSEAIVAAEQATGQKPGEPGFAAVFAREFGRRLAALPATAAMRTYLLSQRLKNAEFTPARIQRDLLNELSHGPDRRGAYTLVEADQIVRAHHRLIVLWPLETALLSDLDAAIAARPALP